MPWYVKFDRWLRRHPLPVEFVRFMAAGVGLTYAERHIPDALVEQGGLVALLITFVLAGVLATMTVDLLRGAVQAASDKWLEEH